MDSITAKKLKMAKPRLYMRDPAVHVADPTEAHDQDGRVTENPISIHNK